MPIRYAQDYSYSTCPVVAQLGNGIVHFVDEEMQPYTLVNRYLADNYRRWSSHTSRTVAEGLSDFLAWMESVQLTLEQVKLRHVEMYMNALADPNVNRPLSLTTVVQRVGHACRFFDWAKRKSGPNILWDGQADAERGLVMETRRHYTRRDTGTITPRLIRQNTRFLHLTDAIKFVEAFQFATTECDRDLVMRNQLMAKIMLQCGLRVEEVVNLPIAWVAEIIVDHRRPMQLGRIQGKGRKIRPVEWPTKLLLEVQEYFDFQRQCIVEKAQDTNAQIIDSGCAFLSSDGTPITTNWVNKLFRRTSKICGIHCTPHMLRHTYGTYHYLIHRDLAKLANLMGHSSEETTRTYYVHTAALIAASGYFDDFQKIIDSKLGVGSAP